MTAQRQEEILIHLSRKTGTCESHLKRRGVTKQEINELIENGIIAILGYTAKTPAHLSESKYFIV